MTRFLRLFLVLFLASMQLSAMADEDEKYEVMEINGVWYKVPYVYVYHYIDDDNGYYRYEPDTYGITVISPPDGFPPYSGDINIMDQLEFNLDGESYPIYSDVTYIEDNAFKNSDITSVYIPPRVYSIGKSAFEGCHNMQRIEFGVFNEWELMGYDNESHSWHYIDRYLWEIGDYAFRDCTSLKNVTVPHLNDDGGGIVYFNGWNLFEGCTSLETVYFEDGLKEIGPYWFYNCANLYEVRMPQSVIRIDIFAFENCRSLQIVELSKNLKEIMGGAFNWCVSLNCVAYEGVESNLAKKYSMVLPESLTCLSENSFSFCKFLRKVYLPASLEEINRDNIYCSHTTFAGCNSLEIIDVDEKNSYFTSVDGSLYSKDMKTLYQFTGFRDSTFTVPDFVTTIEKDAFYGFENLKDIKLNEGLTRIAEGAFYETGLKEVTTPQSLKILDGYAFQKCDSLESVQLNEGLETIGYWAFNDCPLKKVILPSSLKEINNGAFLKKNIECTPLMIINYSETPLPKGSEYSTIFNEQPDLQKMYVPKGCKKAYEKAEGLYAHWAKSFTIYEMSDADGIDKTMNEGMKYSIAGDYLSIDNADNGTAVGIYGIDGRLIASDIVRNGATNINISKHKGRVAILRIGNKKHKVVL